VGNKIIVAKYIVNLWHFDGRYFASMFNSKPLHIELAVVPQSAKGKLLQNNVICNSYNTDYKSTKSLYLGMVRGTT
jgi:hypothetical protein